MQEQIDFTFHGKTFNPEYDLDRLKGQAHRVFNLMSDGQWRTLEEIHYLTGDPAPSVSARLRGFRSMGYIVDRRRRGEPKRGIFEYRLILKG